MVLDHVFVNGDPGDLKTEVSLTNRGSEPCTARVAARAVGLLRECTLELGGGESRRLVLELGPSEAGKWSSSSPVLHEVLLDVTAGGLLSDSRTVRFGLRRITIEGTRMLVDGVPYRMKAALVQGFRSDTLYAEGPREAIVDEVSKALAMGFNTLRLHIKAFDPVYLEVCDELGMFLYCDIPVAEPVDYSQLGADTTLGVRCRRAAREQVLRDRNHPSILLWSAMNELCLERSEARDQPGYDSFVRAVVAEILDADPTRPVIENDWMDPDPDRVRVSPILTAHWYGRLHAGYLEAIELQSEKWAGAGRPLLVTEFGDWGLPSMSHLEPPPFWDIRAMYEAGLAEAGWPGSLAAFITQSQRYQGISDRLQAEVFRRHDHLGGYCVTELTDVPHELNGLLDLDRNVKRQAAAEMAVANQRVLPMLKVDSMVIEAGRAFAAELVVANDGPELVDSLIEIRFATGPADASTGVGISLLPGYRVTRLGDLRLTAPEVPGGHDLVLALKAGGREVARNRYPVHVVGPVEPGGPVRLIGDDPSDALAAVGGEASDAGPLLLMEGALDAVTGEGARRYLEAGETVVILAQEADVMQHFPVPAELGPLATAWGSSVFRFTVDSGWLPSLPRRKVLTIEDSTIHPAAAVCRINGMDMPDDPVVVAFKPAPDPLTGTVVGSLRVGPGTLVFCQYRLCEPAAAGDAAARAVLADLIRAPARLARKAVVDRIIVPDGRTLQVWTLP